MIKGLYRVPVPRNEPILSYAPNSPERARLKRAIEQLRRNRADIPMTIGGTEVYTNHKIEIKPPHDLETSLGNYNQGETSHVQQAIDAALSAKKEWSDLDWPHRVAIFLKAADLISGPYRDRLNAATILGQSKNVFQAEIDAACELADFFRFGAHIVAEIYSIQPQSSPTTWNSNDYRPLEGFIFAASPFNFTSIAGNLPSAPAMMGNTVVWKPSKTSIYSARIIMDVLKEAGLPDGVINQVFVPGPTAAEVVFKNPDLSGVHFTGSTAVFQEIWKTIGNHIEQYRSPPRIVAETGGKNFIFVHHSADLEALTTAIARGAFEFQGQKCSAASRVYVPASLWPRLKERILSAVKTIKVGPPEDFSNFVNAVIDEAAFDKITAAIEAARRSEDADIIWGGTYDKKKGYFIDPTIILAKKAGYITMREEIFGPVLTLYVYEDDALERTLDLVDQTSPYALTGSVFARDRYAINRIMHRLENAAGNFYINDKPTGAVVGQQPFGGARGSGTNDKAGTIFNMMRWVSVRTIKENFLPPLEYAYSFMEET